MLHATLIHTCDIYRASQTITSKKKIPSWGNPRYQDVECRFAALGDTATLSVLGRGVSESYEVRMQATYDVEPGDHIVWKDRDDKKYIVEGVTEAELADAYQEQLLICLVKRTQPS